MIEFGKLSKEIFATLKAFNYDLILYDGDGNVVHEPEDARRFFDRGEDLLVTLYEDGENSSVTLTRSKKIQVSEILSLISTLKNITNKYALIWNLRFYGGQIKPSVIGKGMMSESTKDSMSKLAGMYGTTKSSYLKLGNAKMIIKHSARVDEEIAGSRSRRIDRIFVENSIKERFLLPTTHLIPARAMVQHVSHGGSIVDEIGGHLTRMADAYRDLASCVRHIRTNHAVLPDDAGMVREAAVQARKDIRRVFERVFRNYAKASGNLLETSTLTEGEDLTDRIDVLRSVLCTESVSLDDSVLENLAPHLKLDLTKDDGEVVEESDDLRNPVILEYIGWLESFDPFMEGCGCQHDEDEESDDLTREDMLLPNSPSNDYEREVVKKRPEQVTPNILVDHEID